MTQELYKRHRPKTFDAVVGNRATVDALRGMVLRKRVPHACLFKGPSGCGKTTLARILATAIGCHEMDLREINSSSFRGIDTIRDIESSMRLCAQAGDVKVWLLDEFHKMSNDAQNAFLKATEDTPPHVYFFICTTDPDKILKALRSRLTPFDVSLLPEEQLIAIAEKVVKKEAIKIKPRILSSLAEAAGGSARTMLVLLDKIINVDEKDQEQAIKEQEAEATAAIDICRALINKSGWSVVANILRNLKAEPEQTRWAVLGYARSVLLNPKAGDALHQAYLVIDIFQNNFYDSKEAGLARACFEVLHQPEE